MLNSISQSKSLNVFLDLICLISQRRVRYIIAKYTYSVNKATYWVRGTECVLGLQEKVTQSWRGAVCAGGAAGDKQPNG